MRIGSARHRTVMRPLLAIGLLAGTAAAQQSSGDPDAADRPHRRRYESDVDLLPSGGRRRVVATFRGVAHTLTVFVADTAKR